VYLYQIHKKESKWIIRKNLFIYLKIIFSVHLKQEEKLTVRCGRDGGVESLEVHGMIMLRVKSEEYGRIVIAVDNKESRNIQLQTHPNIDKKLFTNESVIGLKNADRPFPANQDVGVLKWRYTSTDSSEIPLTSKIINNNKNEKIFFFVS
jgi:hypothetical protein